ncbi:hypothetical protein ACWC9H_35415 [Streptomyces sp. NPDC001251]
MPVFDIDPGQSPEAPGTLYFYEQGADPATGFTVTSKGVISAPGGTTAPVAFTGATAGTDAVTTRVTGDSAPRFTVNADGTLEWGGGLGASDCTLDRYAAGGLELNCALRFTNGQLLFGPAGDVNLYWGGAGLLKTDDNLSVLGTLTVAAAATLAGASLSGDLSVAGTTGVTVGTAGGGVRIKEGTNAMMGSATLVAGTVVVNTTKVTANSRIILTAQTSGAAPGALRVSARTAGTSFTITSTSGTDTSLVAWVILEPAP